MEEAYFKNIRQEIISELKNSKNELRIAVAWFTNTELFEELIICLNKGVRVSLIIIDDYINNGEWGLNFQDYINKGGLLYYGNEENPMHHKFCIIDNETLFTGSYNWTFYAENKNVENVLKISDNDYIINLYKEEFDNLTATLRRVQNANIISFEDYELKNLFAIRNYLSNDLYFHGKEASEIKFVEAAQRLMPQNEFFRKELDSFKQLRAVEKNKPIKSIVTIPIVSKINTSSQLISVTKNSLGIKSRINGADGRFAVIIKKENKIPITMSHNFTTIEDNQTSLSIETFKGEDEYAVKNIRLGKFLISDLPKKPAGQASVTVTMEINIKGELLVRARSNDTGNQMEANYYDEGLIQINQSSNEDISITIDSVKNDTAFHTCRTGLYCKH